jgi:hypothetical protein
LGLLTEEGYVSMGGKYGRGAYNSYGKGASIAGGG